MYNPSQKQILVAPLPRVIRPNRARPSESASRGGESLGHLYNFTCGPSADRTGLARRRSSRVDRTNETSGTTDGNWTGTVRVRENAKQMGRVSPVRRRSTNGHVTNCDCGRMCLLCGFLGFLRAQQ